MSNAEIVDGKGRQLQEEFKRYYMSFGSPHKAAMFRSNDITADQFFFSPKAVRMVGSILAKYGGADCMPPKRSDVVMLVGSGTDAIAFAPED